MKRPETLQLGMFCVSRMHGDKDLTASLGGRLRTDGHTGCEFDPGAGMCVDDAAMPRSAEVS